MVELPAAAASSAGMLSAERDRARGDVQAEGLDTLDVQQAVLDASLATGLYDQVCRGGSEAEVQAGRLAESVCVVRGAVVLHPTLMPQIETMRKVLDRMYEMIHVC